MLRRKRLLHVAFRQAIHVGKFWHALSAGLKGPGQGLLPSQFLVVICQRILQHGSGVGIAARDFRQVDLAGQAGRLKRDYQLGSQLWAQVLTAAALPASKQFHDRQVNMFGCHVFHRDTLQIVASLAGGNALQIPARPRVQAQRGLEGIALKNVGMRCQQLLKNAQFQRQKISAKQMGVQLKQLF